ncbi:glycosyltransferase family 2 protein [Psychroserpens sp. SPM9]|uniref:glycosyltransferase family 2 protein n=1 Tax=Psychroserpens sp. SPM9 TaxID=2975598 RepID=UPI0021A32029|nr:glycosyltransferase family 2 protein [Psychroserpens sp. SPM9]MDG5492240.1 glycosyltransferase family 2 protein [Psychroserpens sp. SPM9]
MKLSVIIPVYNGADFIWKSYNSIIDQQVTDIEILYVDNNSEDNSVEKIQEVIAMDDRVKLFKQSKQGSAPARNKGIENASGTYVYFFDVDDEIYPKALQKMINVLDTNQTVDAVFGKMIKSHKGISETKKPDDETDALVLKEKPYWGMFWFSNLKHVVGPPAFLYKRTVFDTIGHYNEDLRIGQDTALDIKLGMTCNVAFLNTYIYLYYKHSTSTIEKAKKKKSKVALHWPRYVKSHLPFYLENDVPLKYKELLYAYLYSTTAKRLCETKGIQNRKQLLKDMLNEIKPVKTPLVLRLFLSIMTIFPYPIFLKVYVYYLAPYFLKNHIEKL